MRGNNGFSLARRKTLNRLLLLSGAIPLVGALVGMLRRIQTRQAPEIVLIPADLAEGLSVAGPVIIYRGNAGELHAYSSRCTHLGCRIDRIQEGEAACPCHGSRFRKDGSVAKGPAALPLSPVRLEPDGTSGGWSAHVPS